MINATFVIASGGILCYSKTFFSQINIDADLESGFLTAISNFGQEIAGGEIRSLNFMNFNFIYSTEEEFKCMFIIVTDIADPEDEVRIRLELLKNEFIKRYRRELDSWTGEITKFYEFDDFVEENVFIPPKLLLVGETGVGKTTIMNLFPGETILELDEDLTEIIQKTIYFSDLKSIKELILREIDLDELVDNSKVYRPLLDSVEVICIVTNSGASNLGRTKRLFERLKDKVKKADFYIVANFQDLKSTSFAPKKIEESFEIKTYGFSAIQRDSKDKMLTLIREMLTQSIVNKTKMNQFQ